MTFNSDASFGYKTATFTITKATPTGTPGYTKLETSGKTLADAKLTVGTIRPAGTIAWDLPLTTVLEDGKAYAWTFTPNDTHNYTILTGTLVPYVDDGMDYIPGVIGGNTNIDVDAALSSMQAGLDAMEIPELLLLVMETSLVSLCMKIMSVLITVILYGRMIEIYLYCSVSPIPFATMTNREWGQIGNNYLKALFALGFQGFLIMICVGIYAVLVGSMIVADNLHSAIFSLAAYTVILCFSLFKTGALAKSIFNAH